MNTELFYRNLQRTEYLKELRRIEDKQRPCFSELTAAADPGADHRRLKRLPREAALQIYARNICRVPK